MRSASSLEQSNTPKARPPRQIAHFAQKLLQLSPSRRQKVLIRIIHRNTSIHIAFEDIYDPHNVMAATRAIDAFGFQYVHLIFNKQTPFSPKKIGKKTSASANKWLSFYTYKNKTAQSTNSGAVSRFLHFAQTHNFKLIATILDPKATSLPEFDWSKIKKGIILFGNEHAGLSQELIDASHYKLYIPMYGFVQSLNLSVSVGIVLYDYIAKHPPNIGPATLGMPLQTGKNIHTPSTLTELTEFLRTLNPEKLETLKTWLNI